MRERLLTQRPPDFRLDRHNPLARGLVFAGLGRSQGSLQYRDSSPYGNHGVLTAMEPSDWVWSQELGRWVLDFDGTDGYAIQSSAFGGGSVGDFTISWWMRTTISSGPVFPFGVYEDGTTGGFDIGLNTQDGSNNTTGYIRYYVRDSSGNADSARYTLAGTLWRSGEWVHHLLTRSGGTTLLYGNGSPSSLTFISNSLGADAITFARPLAIGARNVRGTVGGFADVDISDPLIHNRALSLPEIRILANRSDPMLGGLVLPPRRKLWAVSGGGTPPAKKIPVFLNQYRQRVA